MAIEIPKPTKGPWGYMLDMRKSMKAIELSAAKWCVAFDKGDIDALAAISELIGEHTTDAQHAASQMMIAQGADK